MELEKYIKHRLKSIQRQLDDIEYYCGRGPITAYGYLIAAKEELNFIREQYFPEDASG